jgi:hypothetical protein
MFTAVQYIHNMYQTFVQTQSTVKRESKHVLNCFKLNCFKFGHLHLIATKRLTCEKLANGGK